MTIPSFDFTIILVIERQKISENSYALVTLDEGKTLEDLKGGPDTFTVAPDWVYTLGRETQFEGTSSKAFNMARMPAFYKGEPFYVVCFYTDPDISIRKFIGAFGPIIVKK
jgi:hypothetical protein